MNAQFLGLASEVSKTNLEQLTLHGMWAMRSTICPHPLERTFSDAFIYLNSQEDGYAFFPSEEQGALDEVNIGEPLSITYRRSNYLAAACLDILTRCSNTVPSAFHFLSYSGGIQERAEARAGYIVNTILSFEARPGRRLRGIMIGASFLQARKFANFEVDLIIYDLQCHGTSCGDRLVRKPTDYSIEIYDTDFVIATGMTLSTGAASQIMNACKRRNIPLYFYCCTAPNFGRWLPVLGVKGVFAEEFPFYIGRACDRISFYTGGNNRDR